MAAGQPMTERAQAREAAASVAQYLLLGGFAAVAAGISAQGLTGFARDNMGLRGAWPYLLFLALDGAAGVCAALLTRRAARAESALAPRLAVWGLVVASSSFNWTHAPQHPGAPEAFGLMPVIAAVLFEFTLRELRLRTTRRADRALTTLRWLHPAERIRVQLRLAADDQISAETATRRVRVDQAARRLYLLRRRVQAGERGAQSAPLAAGRARLAERRAHAALTRVGFADPSVAAEVLRQVQVLTRTRELARLDYATAEAAHAVIASLINPCLPAVPAPDVPAWFGVPDYGSTSRSDPPAAGRGSARPEGTRTTAADRDGDDDSSLIAAAARILAEARQRDERLGQAALGHRLRLQGHHVANHRLRWLMSAASDVTAQVSATSSEVGPRLPDASSGSDGPPLGRPAGPAAADPQLNGQRFARQPGHNGPAGEQ